MLKALRPLAVCFLLATTSVSFTLTAQHRSVDGSDNNLSNPEWGAAGHMMLNTCTPMFADGAEAPAGANRPNPRQLSNAVFAQHGEVFSPQNLNDLWWAFGQFLDHDLTLTGNSEREFFPIAVPIGDPLFDADSTGTAIIPMTRSVSVADADGMRRFRNEITSFVDASNVYGSDATRANFLRSFTGGRLRTSAGDLPPFNTLTGEYGAPVDPDAPHMEGMRSPTQRVFVCGDVRANENSLLLAFHTVFIREHNRLCDSLAAAGSAHADEELYQHARRLVEGVLQRITYGEWLPAMGLTLPVGAGYDASVDPTVSNEFAAAAFRFGHTLVGRELWALDAEGQHTATSPLAVRDVFFDPVNLLRQEGLATLLRGAAVHRQQALDCKVVDELRSFLFGAPGAGGLDLVALNVNRGRERGVADFQTMRRDLGLPAKQTWREVTGDARLAAELGRLYGDVEDVDAWVGLLAEGAERGEFGETLAAVLVDQFVRLRSGDRFFYDVHPENSARELNWLERQTLSAVFARNVPGITARERSFEATSLSTVVPRDAPLGSEIRATLIDGELSVFGEGVEGVSYQIDVVDLTGRSVARFAGRSAGSYALGGSVSGVTLVRIDTETGSRVLRLVNR